MLTFRERVISPVCCDEIQKYLVIQLRVPFWPFVDVKNVKPIWKAIVNYHPDHLSELLEKQDGLSNEWPVANYCPFCGAKVPEVVPAEPDPNKKYCVVTDGGYYCDTCSERLHVCECYPPEHLWKAEVDDKTGA